jgi:hypothetical protein
MGGRSGTTHIRWYGSSSQSGLDVCNGNRITAVIAEAEGRSPRIRGLANRRLLVRRRATKPRAKPFTFSMY